MDLTFVTGPNGNAGCDVERLWREPILAALPSEHPQAGAATLTLADLGDDRFVVSRTSPGVEVYEYIVRRLNGLSRPRVDALDSDDVRLTHSRSF